MKRTAVLTRIALLSSLTLPFVAIAIRKRAIYNRTPVRLPSSDSTSERHNHSRRHMAHPWIVFNPSKVADPQAFRQRVNQYMVERGIPDVHWIDTTPHDPGTLQTVHAVHEGASIVIAIGGDGTVRATCAALAHSGIPLGIVPMGTGNILARNLKIPLGHVEAALDVIIGSCPTPLDLAWLRARGSHRFSMAIPEGTLLSRAYVELGIAPDVSHRPISPHEYAFVAISGAGFDGETMAHTDPAFKRKVGWWAYVFSALKAMWIERTRMCLHVHSDARAYPPPAPATAGAQKSHRHRSMHEVSRCVLFANCGQLPVISLVPSADPTDGLLDVVTVNTRAGIVGWASLMVKIFAQGYGMRFPTRPHSLATMSCTQSPSTTAFFASARPVQVDGDAIGRARIVHVRVDHAALLIAAPRK